MQMNGNTVLVTGGGSGIGEALAAEFHARGNQVIIAGRRPDALARVAAAHPGMATATVDIGDADDIRRFAEAIVAEYPSLNVVLHNAGIMRSEDLRAVPFDLDAVEATVATNLLGPIRLHAALQAHLLAQPRAAVLTVTSGLAFVPLVGTPTYSATKAALHSWTQSLRFQMRGTGVDVIEIVPPAVATDLVPGHRESPHSMPLDAFIAETMALLDEGGHDEICVRRVDFLRNAEAHGTFAQVLEALNAS
ncbi:MAG: SDR family oxidoreductase [Pseudomonadota bacterium]